MLTYVYKITVKETGQFYHGLRTIKKPNRSPACDLFVTYFTSSKTVKSLVKKLGINAFATEVIFINENHGEGYFLEQRLIKDSIDDPLCLNKQYFDFGKGKTIFSNFGNTHSLEQKERWSKIRKGCPAANKGIRYSSEKKVNMKNKNKGRSYEEIYGDQAGIIKEKIKSSSQSRSPITSETRLKLKAAQSRRTPESYRRAAEKLKNRVFSEETLFRMSIAKKGKPAHNKGIPTTKVSCVICHKECDVRSLGRYHKHNP